MNRILFPVLVIAAVVAASWRLGVRRPENTDPAATNTPDVHGPALLEEQLHRTVSQNPVDAPRTVEPADRYAPAFHSSEPLPPGVDYPEGAAPIDPLNSGITLVEATETSAAPPAPALFSSTSTPRLAAVEAVESEFSPLPLAPDLAGWVVLDGKPEAWRVEQGLLVCDRGNGGWLRTGQPYSDFELRCDVRFAPGANTGVAFRFPDAGSPPATGIEVQLLDDDADKYASLRSDQHSGSLYYLLAPTAFQPLAASSWHDVRLYVCGDVIRVTLNGAVVNEVDISQLPAGDEPHPLRRRPHQGYVGFQCSAQRVEFRNIRLRDLIRRDDSGVGVLDLASGTGDVCPQGATVTVDYCGRLLDGRQFDSSYDRGEPITVPLSDVIPGWQVGIPGMRVGGRRKLVVPAAMAYGDQGVGDLVPPGATLVFEVELRGVER